MPVERANDPRVADYGSAGTAVRRNVGTTDSERYLAKLADKSFLNLWSYPNPFIDKKIGGKGQGKELCDLLVVCGDHVLIFSDKTVSWPESEDTQLSWRRWYKRAISKSVDQIRGAERWINTHPDRIFLDPLCLQPLPLSLPPSATRRFHGIVVARGAAAACKEFFEEGIGSLMIMPEIKGDDHWRPESIVPFSIGDIEPSGSFIHVLDEATLDIVLGELDTISDFTSYLAKKESLIRSGALTAAGGEEDLVAYFMTHMNMNGEHDFTKQDKSPFGPNDSIAVSSGFYSELITNPQYIAKKTADKKSYVWDRLIEQFTNHLLAGTTLVPEGQKFVLSEHEQGVRHMALVPRFMRRVLGEAILETLTKGANAPRFVRMCSPDPETTGHRTGYLFMTLAIPESELIGGYEQYRLVRRNILEAYALAFLKRYPKFERVVGIATEPLSPRQGVGSSEDLIVVETPSWTAEMLSLLEERMEGFDIMRIGTYSETPIQGSEFPDLQTGSMRPVDGGLNRKQRRAKLAEQRKSAKLKRHSGVFTTK